MFGVVFEGVISLDLADGFVGDLPDNAGWLNRRRDVMNKIDQKTDAGKTEADADRDRDRRDKARPFARAVFANRAKDDDAVSENPDKRAEHDLIARIAHKIAQYARRKLRRSQC